MAKKRFTEEEIEQLRKNPYVDKVTDCSVFFTIEFKRYFHSQRKASVPVYKILRDCGIDPDILGEKRIEGIRHTIKKAVEDNKEFTDSSHKIKFKEEKERVTTEARIKYLEHELAYTKQEVEFLKKIRMADLEAQKQWESKHRQK